MPGVVGDPSGVIRSCRVCDSLYDLTRGLNLGGIDVQVGNKTNRLRANRKTPDSLLVECRGQLISRSPVLINFTDDDIGIDSVSAN